MGGALFLAVVGGITGAGILFHTGHPFSAIGVTLMAYVAVRWLWINYT